MLRLVKEQFEKGNNINIYMTFTFYGVLTSHQPFRFQMNIRFDEFIYIFCIFSARKRT